MGLNQELPKRFKLSRLAVKLIFVTSIALIIVLIIQTFVTTSRLQDELTDHVAEDTYNLSEVIKSSTRKSMVDNRKSDLNYMFSDIAEHNYIFDIHLYDKTGEIVYSADTTAIGEAVDIESSRCAPCHAHTTPLDELSIEDRTQVDRTDAGNFLIILNPIQNEPDCYNAACHAHSPDDKLLGVLEVKMSLEQIDQIVKDNVTHVVSNSIAGMLIIALLIGFLITITVNRQLRKISYGIRRIGSGDLKHRIVINTDDELSDVANQLNRMSEKLLAANTEIKEWNQTLNRKVEEKTEELKKLYAQVTQVEKLASLGKLAASVAHELNNPLAGILNFSKLIKKRLLKRQQENEYDSIIGQLELISEESDRCGRIVKDLLLFSHRDEEEFKDENLVAIANKATLLLDHHLEMHKINLVRDFATEEIHILCDAQKIQQALLSLMINATEAMDEGGTLTIRLNADDEHAFIRIIDEGHGINQDDLPHIFEPFYTTKAQGKGTGLGLSVLYGIIINHNGNVEVESTSPSGTTFKVSLPISNNKTADDHE